MLSNLDIMKCIEGGDIAIEPFNEQNLGPVSLDLTLAGVFIAFRGPDAEYGASEYVIWTDRSRSALVTEDDALVTTKPFYKEYDVELIELKPGSFILGVTQERITLSDKIVGKLDGRSSLARVGLTVHATAHTIEPGWDGYITLEIKNINKYSLFLCKGQPIASIQFDRLDTPARLRVSQFQNDICKPIVPDFTYKKD